MKTVIGIVLMVIGIIVGLYVGGYLCFIKGITQLIQSITPEVIASGIGWGIGMIILASFAGGTSCAVIFIPGFLLFKSK